MKKLQIGESCAYENISASHEVQMTKSQRFLIIVYGAYNAYGLIGTEKNGIAILDMNNKIVIADEIFIGKSGEEQREEASRCAALSWKEFCAYVNEQETSRQPIPLKRVKVEKDPFARLANLAALFDSGEVRPECKETFLKTAKHACKAIAEILELPKETYSIRVNRGGPAVIGEVTLHADHLYLQFSPVDFGSGPSFMYRECMSQKDYTGLHNQWAKFSDLKNPKPLLRYFKQIIEDAQIPA